MTLIDIDMQRKLAQARTGGKTMTSMQDWSGLDTNGLRASNNPSVPGAVVIAAGPTFKREGEYPSRIVLCAVDGEKFVVWLEVFKPEGTSNFSTGHYFSTNEFVEAYDKFIARLSDQFRYSLPAFEYQARQPVG